MSLGTYFVGRRKLRAVPDSWRYIAIWHVILNTALSRPTVGDRPPSERICMCPGRIPVVAGPNSSSGKSLGRIVGVPSLWPRPGGVLQQHGSYYVKLASNRPTSGWPVMLPQWATANRERQGALTQSLTTIARDPFYREWLCGAGQGCRRRITERLHIDNCLPLTVELFHQLAFSF